MARKIKKKYHYNGELKSIHFYKKNKLHREDGPAVIMYGYNGDIIDELYYRMGKKLNEQEFNMFYRDFKLKRLLR